MAKKSKKTAWHKKKGRMVSSKYAKERPKGDSINHTKSKQSNVPNKKAQKFMTNLKAEIKKAVRDE